MARTFKDLKVDEQDGKVYVTLHNRDGSVALRDVAVEISSKIVQQGDAWNAAAANLLLRLDEEGKPKLALTPAQIGAAEAVHTHNYAGAASAGGAAATALACTGNAATATKLQTARSLTLGKTGKNFDGTANVTWTLAEMGILDFVYPIGSIFEWASVSGATGPSLTTVAAVQAHFGGQWEAYGVGRVLAGLDASQTEFGTVGKTGGAKTHKLVEAELPVISGRIHSGEGAYGATGGGYGNIRSCTGVFTGSAQSQYRLGTLAKQQWVMAGNSPELSYQYANLKFGGNQAHNNLQPYITVYRYRRIG